MEIKASEKPTQTEATAIEETLKEAAGKSWEYNSKTLGEPINPTAFILGFGAGANWQKQQRNDEVDAKLKSEIEKYKAEYDLHGVDDDFVIWQYLLKLTTLLSTINKK